MSWRAPRMKMPFGHIGITRAAHLPGMSPGLTLGKNGRKIGRPKSAMGSRPKFRLNRPHKARNRTDMCVCVCVCVIGITPQSPARREKWRWQHRCVYKLEPCEADSSQTLGDLFPPLGFCPLRPSWRMSTPQAYPTHSFLISACRWRWRRSAQGSFIIVPGRAPPHIFGSGRVSHVRPSSTTSKRRLAKLGPMLATTSSSSTNSGGGVGQFGPGILRVRPESTRCLKQKAWSNIDRVLANSAGWGAMSNRVASSGDLEQACRNDPSLGERCSANLVFIHPTETKAFGVVASLAWRFPWRCTGVGQNPAQRVAQELAATWAQLPDTVTSQRRSSSLEHGETTCLQAYLCPGDLSFHRHHRRLSCEVADLVECSPTSTATNWNDVWPDHSWRHWGKQVHTCFGIRLHFRAAGGTRCAVG